jgi:hypothetical protein
MTWRSGGIGKAGWVPVEQTERAMGHVEVSECDEGGDDGAGREMGV